MLTDTHTHLFLPEFDADRDEMFRRAAGAGVTQFLLPNIDLESIRPMMRLAESRSDCRPMLGLHPCSVNADVERQLDEIFSHFREGIFVAIGEIGMDLYWDKTFVKEQEYAFRKQLQIAKEKKLPVAIHTREAFSEAYTIVKEENDENLRGVFHCFGGTLREAELVMETEGFYLGIGGVVTFKKSGLDVVLKDIPLEYIVLETDSPYLAPVPFRGKRNESGHLKLIAEHVAEIKGISFEEVAEITTANAAKLFGI